MRISRRGVLVLFSIVIIAFLLMGSLTLPEEKEKKEVKHDYTYEMIMEDTELNARYYDSINEKNESTDYQRVKLDYKKKTDILGYQLTKTHTFEKLVQFTGPLKNKYIKGKKANNVAYVFLLKGDLVKRYDKGTKSTDIIIENGHIDVRKISYVINDSNKVTYLYKNGKSNSMNFYEFKDDLNSIEKVLEMREG